MKVGAIIPQGWTGEYDRWNPEAAWRRTVEVAQQAERLGFESIWLFDHFHTVPDPTDEITFESFTSLAALAALTRRARLGHIVICTAFRNPALTAKMISTLDVISGGRMELGIGAGWKRDEWLAYGYGFPETKERLARLSNDLEVITRMLEPGPSKHATYEGRYVAVNDAINVPKPIQQPRVPIMIGGNGPNVTWRLAARFADELNLDGLSPEALTDALPVIHARCEEIGRDPATLPVSVHIWPGNATHEGARMRPPMVGQVRVDLLGRYHELGVSRVMHLVRESADSDEALELSHTPRQLRGGPPASGPDCGTCVGGFHTRDHSQMSGSTPSPRAAAADANARHSATPADTSPRVIGRAHNPVCRGPICWTVDGRPLRRG